MTDHDETQRLFEALVQERGGADVLGIAGLAICRAASVALTAADMDARSASAADSLLARLPQPAPVAASAPSPGFDASQLSDRELDGFLYLTTKAEVHLGSGPEPAKPRKPDKRLRGGRCESMREYRLRELGREWDRIEREGVKPSPEVAEQFGALVSALLPKCDGPPLVLLADMWPWTHELARRELERAADAMAGRSSERAAPAASPAAAAPEAPESERVIPPDCRPLTNGGDNVIPFVDYNDGRLN